MDAGDVSRRNRLAQHRLVVIPERFACTKRGARTLRLAASRSTAPDTMLPDRPARARPLTLGELVVLLFVAWALWAMGAHAQLVPVKTAPVATGSQFQLYPSHARGMGGVHLAVDDTLGDAFVNPATAARLNGTWAFSAPSHYTITEADGGARMLSVGVLVDRAGQPGVQTGGVPRTAEFAAVSDLVGAPRGPLALRERQVFTHQISVAIPIRNGNE